MNRKTFPQNYLYRCDCFDVWQLVIMHGGGDQSQLTYEHTDDKGWHDGQWQIMFVQEALDAYRWELHAGGGNIVGSGPEDTSFRVSFFDGMEYYDDNEDPRYSCLPPTMTVAALRAITTAAEYRTGNTYYCRLCNTRGDIVDAQEESNYDLTIFLHGHINYHV